MSVVITGVGAVAAIGGGDAFFQALDRGETGIGEITTFDPGDRESILAGEIAEFALEEYLASAKTYLDRASSLALAAGAVAMGDSGLAVARGEGGQAGVSFGTAYGCLSTMGAFWEGTLEKGPRLASSLLFTHSYANTPVSLASIEFNLAGAHSSFCAGAASGGQAIADGATQIRVGRARAMLAGGLEALSPYLHAAFADGGILSAGDGHPEGIRPFAASRNGTVLGEGAGMLLLEAEDAARERGARVRARLLGCGFGGGAGSTASTAAMSAALSEAGVAPDEVDALFASASGARNEDAWEARAIGVVLGGRRVPVVALKALIGETLGAAGALATVAAVHAIESGILPGSPEMAAPEFPLDLVREPRRASLRRVLVNAFDARGGCVSLVLGAP